MIWKNIGIKMLLNNDASQPSPRNTYLRAPIFYPSLFPNVPKDALNQQLPH